MQENLWQPVLELRHLSKTYAGLPALTDINLSIGNGEFITLLGPSGCGKTTILRLLSGFEKPDSGEILINNQVVNELPPEKRQVNTVFQEYALFPHMDVFNNVAFGLKMKKCSGSELKEQVLAALRMVHLEDLAKRQPDQLSGGQQQRVAIARAVVNKPLVLLLDEPFSALDYNLRRKMQSEIKQLQRQLGITFVFVTHDQEEAFAMSDRVVVMKQGHIEQIGTPQAIYEQPASLYVAKFIGEINILPAVIVKQPAVGMYLVKLFDLERLFPIQSERNFGVGESVHVLLRPEDLRIYAVDDPDLPAQHLQGKILDTSYRGATVGISIVLDGIKTELGDFRLEVTEFFNEDDVEISYGTGEKVAISWVDGWEVVLPYEA